MRKKTIIREYNLTYKRRKYTGKVCLAFLTDLHNCLSEKEQEIIFGHLYTVKPDVVLVGGDVLIGKRGQDVKLAAYFMKKLSEKYLVIYANGNHEQRIRKNPEKYGDMAKQYEDDLCKTKVIRALNQKIDLEINKIPLCVYGYEPDERFYEKGSYQKGMLQELMNIFGNPDEETCTILLSHNPKYVKEYLSWGADLTLSGHYHGGVVLLGEKRGVIAPDYRLFSEECCGIRSQEHRHMIVSAGLGEHTIPVRIHNPREITVVRLDFS